MSAPRVDVCIYAVPQAASNVGASSEVVRRLFSNVSTVWEATACPLRTGTARRCFRSAIATAATASPRAVSGSLIGTLTAPNNSNSSRTARRSPKPNRVVPFLLPRPPPPRLRPPSPTATGPRTTLVISSIKVWERSGWWRRSHARRGKGRTIR